MSRSVCNKVREQLLREFRINAEKANEVIDRVSQKHGWPADKKAGYSRDALFGAAVGVLLSEGVSLRPKSVEFSESLANIIDGLCCEFSNLSEEEVEAEVRRYCDDVGIDYSDNLLDDFDQHETILDVKNRLLGLRPPTSPRKAQSAIGQKKMDEASSQPPKSTEDKLASHDPRLAGNEQTDVELAVYKAAWKRLYDAEKRSYDRGAMVLMDKLLHEETTRGSHDLQVNALKFFFEKCLIEGQPIEAINENPLGGTFIELSDGPDYSCPIPAGEVRDILRDVTTRWIDSL